MITCRCIKKFRDRNGAIKGYRLQDNQGTCLDVKPDQLKMAIFSKQLDVINLKLTTDSRLIDKQEESDKNIANAFKPSSDEKILEQLLELAKRNKSDNENDYNEWNNEDISKAIKLFGLLGVNINKLELPSKQYIGCKEFSTQYYCGLSKIWFSDQSMYDLSIKDTQGNNICDIKNIAELKHIVNTLKSECNTKCISYGAIHKICTMAILNKIINDNRLKNYCICFSWDVGYRDDIYCVPLGMSNKDINDRNFNDDDADKVIILIGLDIPDKPHNNNECYEIIIDGNTKNNKEYTRKIVLNIHNGDLKRTYREIETAIETILKDM